ncbi:MAG: hypothetical protein JXA69_02950 [Phycisphaerae bacterium]|nr:hypothetical protein [Phycisphaerae bacterium]
MRFHRDTMQMDPAWAQRLRQAGLDTADRVLKHVGDQVVAWSRSTETVRVDLPAHAGHGAVFVKRYHHLQWRRRLKAMLRGTFLGRTRARAEFERLQELRDAGAPVAYPVAYGERRILHFVRSSFLITEAVENAVSLTTFAQQQGNGRRASLPSAVRRQMIESLGRCIGALHGKGLVHGALVWRNVLVRFQDDPVAGVEFILLDADGRRRLGTLGRGEGPSPGVVGDLAALAALASVFCSRTEMLRFFHAYLGVRRLDAGHRQLARDVLARAERQRDHELYRLKMNDVFHYHLVPIERDP